ncbi:MAG: ABC transporter permease [Bacteroidota bacterium]
MLYSYFKIALRVIIKNHFHVTINILGMGIAVAVALVSFVNLRNYQQYDAQHENKDRIYRLISERKIDDAFTPYGLSPIGLADDLKSNFPEFNSISRYDLQQEIVINQEKIFRERVAFTDVDFTSMFTLKKLVGEISLTDKTDILLSESAALRYFINSDNALGNLIQVKTDKGEKLTFTVAGIFKDFPENSSFNFDVLLSI